MNQNVPLMENMKKVHVLAETYQLLKNKHEELKINNLSVNEIEGDLSKIENELKTHTGENNLDTIMSAVNEDLIYPQYADY